MSKALSGHFDNKSQIWPAAPKMLDFPSPWFGPPQLFHTCFCDHAHRLRLEKLLCLELSRSSNGFCKPLLDPDDRTAVLEVKRQKPKI